MLFHVFPNCTEALFCLFSILPTSQYNHGCHPPVHCQSSSEYPAKVWRTIPLFVWLDVPSYINLILTPVFHKWNVLSSQIITSLSNMSFNSLLALLQQQPPSLINQIHYLPDILVLTLFIMLSNLIQSFVQSPLENTW